MNTKRAAVAIAMLDATRALAGHCHETSKVVGHEVCLSFGDRWAHQALGDFEKAALEIRSSRSRAPRTAMLATCARG